MLSPTDGCADLHGVIAKKIAQVLQPTTVFDGTVEVLKCATRFPHDKRSVFESSKLTLLSGCRFQRIVPALH